MSELLLPSTAAGPARRSRVVRTRVAPGRIGRAVRAADRTVAPPDDPVRRFSRWVRRSFPNTDDASASVIGGWMTAMFVTGACQRLADDLARLGHVADGTAAALARTSERSRDLTTALRSSPTSTHRRHVTASQLDEIRRQLRLETGMVARRLATVVEAADPTSRRVLDAVVDAAIWLGVLDLRGAVEELCAADRGSEVGVAGTLEAFHDAMAPALRPRRADARRVVRGRRPRRRATPTP